VVHVSTAANSQSEKRHDLLPLTTDVAGSAPKHKNATASSFVPASEGGVMFSKSVALRSVCLAFLLSITSASWGQNELFQAPQAFYSGAGGAFSIAVGDINADGKPDLLVANSSGVGVLPGNGDGTFQAAVTYDSGGWYASSIAVGDINRDGRLDVLVANLCFRDCPGEGGVGVLLGNGDGTFQPVRTYGTGGQPFFGLGDWMAIGDVNGDGQLDVLVANGCLSPDCKIYEGGVGVLMGNGDGTFQAAQSYDSGGTSAQSITVADVNGDGKLDVLVTNYWSGTYDAGSVVSVLMGNDDGTFQVAQNYYSGGRATTSIAVADVNEDGKPDLFVAHECRGDSPACGQKGFVGTLMGNGDGTFQVAQSYGSGGAWAQSIAVADVNEDGKLDLLVANRCNRGMEYKCIQDPNGHPSVVGVLLGNGNGTFQDPQTYKSGSFGAGSIAVADINGDGVPDLLVANGDAIVMLGRFGTTTTLKSNLNPSVYGQSVTVAATVSSRGPNAPSGTVTFKNGSKWLHSVTLIDGVAMLTTKALPVGTLSINATYNGAPESIKSTSLPVIQVVSTASSTTTIKSSVNPSAQGQPVKFTATVTSPTAKITGTVTFTAGTTTLGTVTLSGGKANITTSALPQGSNSITATYGGTANIVGSGASLTQIVE
jgi:hypothetical protein